MPAFRDLRQFIEQVSALGELRTIRAADADLEVGAITEVAAQAETVPMLLFEQIHGCAPEYRVLTHLLSSPARENVVYGVPAELDDAQAMRVWKDRCRHVEPLAPRVVSDGPVLARVETGDEVDLTRLPFIRWHEGDGGRYLCATAAVTRDPDDGYINVG